LTSTTLGQTLVITAPAFSLHAEHGDTVHLGIGREGTHGKHWFGDEEDSQFPESTPVNLKRRTQGQTKTAAALKLYLSARS